jgi:hypothetical protein
MYHDCHKYSLLLSVIFASIILNRTISCLLIVNVYTKLLELYTIYSNCVLSNVMPEGNVPEVQTAIRINPGGKYSPP